MVLKIMFVGAVLLVASCQSSRQTASFGGGSEKLYAHTWTLVEVEGQPVNPAGTDRDAHLLFALPNRLTGSTGCNRLTGTFELTGGNAIRFSPLATTRMMCPDSETEARFTKALQRVDTYLITDAALALRSGKTVVARFRADTPKTGQ
jgi:heat shock protein HslJ